MSVENPAEPNPVSVHVDFSTRELRNVCGLFTTGVAVVTIAVEGHVYGITVNSFTSVSLHPPLVLFCLSIDSRFLTQLSENFALAINFLTEEQEIHSRYFANQSGGEVPEYLHHLAPILRDAAGGLLCAVDRFIPAGDHVIVLSRVQGIWTHQEPSGSLLYHRGRYTKAPKHK